jgi:type VI secretion system ImpM family protein
MTKIGLFGKMPSAGDFVSRGFSPVICDKLNDLLQSTLLSASADSVERRQLMAQAHPVMLSIRAGVVCNSGFFGLWFPSSDRVGRVFPMCVGIETSLDEAKWPLTWPSKTLTHVLCQTVSGSFQQGDGPDELVARLPSPEHWSAVVSDSIPFEDVGEETVPAISIQHDSIYLVGPESHMSISGRALCSRLPWLVEMLGTIVGEDGNHAVFFGKRNIKSEANLAALFDGQWNRWGWETFGAKEKS